MGCLNSFLKKANFTVVCNCTTLIYIIAHECCMWFNKDKFAVSRAIYFPLSSALSRSGITIQEGKCFFSLCVWL